MSEARIAKYTIPGDPIPWARPGGKSTRFDTQKQIKLIYGITLREQHEGPLFLGPLHIDIRFYMAVPQRLSPRKAKDLHDSYHHIRPDFSNMLKLIEDIGTGIIYKDDAQIAKFTGEKKYDSNPRTVFTISELR